jgi:Ca2+-binding EF-hand superfamily protein
MEQFVQCMTSPKMKFSEASARALFNAFDTDGNNQLSLKELGVGFSKLSDGSVDDRLLLLFQAYDTDRSGWLDARELAHMIRVAGGGGAEDASRIAASVMRSADANADARLDFMEFRDAAYRQLIPVAVLWSEGSLDFVAGGGRHNSQGQEYNNVSKRKNEYEQQEQGQRQRQEQGQWQKQGQGQGQGQGQEMAVSRPPPDTSPSGSTPRRGTRMTRTHGSPPAGSPQQGQGQGLGLGQDAHPFSKNRPPPLAIPAPAVRFAPAVMPTRKGGGGNPNPFGRK